MATSTSETPTVQEAWASVMGEIRELGKDSVHNSPGARFNYRGIDDLMNAVGPVLRTNGVAIVPTTVDLRTRDTQTSTGKPAQEATVMVTYTIYGPSGDSIPGGSAGGAMDSGDKATPKAMSVAFRTFLLQALCLPTHEADPDSQAYERAGGPSDEERELQEKAQAFANGLGQCTHLDILEQKRAEAEATGLLSKTVTYLGQQGILAGAFGHRIQQLKAEGEAAA